MKVLSILGQRPAMTGSGVVVSESFRAGVSAGDQHHLICAGYANDNWTETFGDSYEMVTFTEPGGAPGEIPFPVPGMSDVMPYPSAKYSDLQSSDVDTFLQGYRHRLDRAVSQLKPDVLHIHHLWLLTELAGLTGVPCVVTIHGTDLHQAHSAPAHRHRVAANLHHVDRFICVSNDIRDELCRLYDVDRGRVEVIGNGFDENVFRVAGPTRQRDRKLVLCAGKFIAWKGFQYAMRASNRVSVPHDLVILGDGPAEQRELLLAEARHLGSHIHLPGHVAQHELATWMRSANVFLLTSVHEPFGLVLLESMACGCRVAASGSGGPRDIVAPDLVKRGLATLVEPLTGDTPSEVERYTHDFAQALDFQLSQDALDEDRRDIAASVSHRSWHAYYERLRDIYLALYK